MMFQDEMPPFSDDTLKLSMDIGPSIDIGSPMMVKIVMSNG